MKIKKLLEKILEKFQDKSENNGNQDDFKNIKIIVNGEDPAFWDNASFKNHLRNRNEGFYSTHTFSTFIKDRESYPGHPNNPLDMTVFLAYLIYKCQHCSKPLTLQDMNNIRIAPPETSGLYYKWGENESVHDDYIYLNYDLHKKNMLKMFIYIIDEEIIDDSFKEIDFDIDNKQKKEENTMPTPKSDNASKAPNILNIIENAIQNNHQVVFTGAPGTGKTYGVKECVKDLTDNDSQRSEFIQFHPSYDYTDFVEGLKPVTTNTEEVSFVLLDGHFKKFCRKIVESNLDSAIEKANEMKVDIDTSDKENFFEACFNLESTQEKLPKEVLKIFRQGGELEKPYYFMIDEINRADLSKVFGELMYGLEESYRGIEHRFQTQYSNLKTYEIKEDGTASPMEFDCFKKGFFIPHNLYLIGTMNDIDRSVETFDFALRRRFQWIDIKANEIMEKSLEIILKSKKNKINIHDLSNKVTNMNKLISGEKYGKKFGLSASYHIGPAYFKEYDGNNLDMILNQRISPLLREYCRGRDENSVNNFLEEVANKLKEADTQEKKNESQN